MKTFRLTARGAVPSFLPILVLATVGQAAVSPDAVVKLADGRVSIQATATPLASILDRLARSTGMKVVYDGPPPTQRMTAAIEAGSETEALSRLLEGSGLTYAFKLDEGGRHVQALFITGAATRRGGSSSPATASSPGMTQSAAPDEAEETMAAPAPEAEPDAAASPAMPEAPMGGGGVALSGTVAGAEQAPAFPSGASFPGPNSGAPGFPFGPVTPGPYSYPSRSVSPNTF